MSMELEKLVDGLVAAKNEFNTALGEEREVKRKALIELAGQIITEAQEPWERMFDYMTQAAEMSVSRTFMEWRAFDLIPDQGSISYDDFAAKLGADVVLVRRFCRILVARKVLVQVGDDAIAHTNHSREGKHRSAHGAYFKIAHDCLCKSAPDWPAYFEKYGRKEPSEPSFTPMSFSHGEDASNYWDILYRIHVDTVQTCMQDLDIVLPVSGMFPFKWIAENSHLVAPDAPLVVDIGGGRGQSLQGIMEECPDIPAERLVLQDMPSVIENGKQLKIEALEDIQRVPIDFFVDLPVKGSLTYLLRRIIHDWNDRDCVKVLSNIKAVMAPESRILLMDHVMQSSPHPIGTTSDLIMMNVGGKERSVQEWHALVEKAELQLVKIWQYPYSSAAVVECKLTA
ncbi:O-methyltransferase-domain-containing protein [Phyllosticta capitalensis]